jgi:hypothetical protein
MSKSRKSVSLITILCLLFSVLCVAEGAPITSKIQITSAPYVISIWSVDKETKERRTFLCNATLIDKQFAVTTASCLKSNSWPIVGSYGTTDRSQRGLVFPIFTWTWPDEFEKDPKFTDLALLYAPFGISPWNEELKQKNAIPVITYPRAGTFDLISWDETDGASRLSLKTLKTVGTIPLAKGKLPKDNVFYAGAKLPGKSDYLDSCKTIGGSPLVQRTKTGLKLVGISVAPNAKCSSKLPIKFMLVSKFSEFITKQKIQLQKSYLDERYGESIKPILESIRPSDSKQYLDSTVDGDGRRSVIWTSYDPESGWADVWSLGFFVWKNGRYQATLIFRNSLDGCMLSKKGSVLLQLSRNSEQKVDYSVKVSDLSNCWVAGQQYSYPSLNSSAENLQIDCSVSVSPYGDKWSTDPNEKIKNLSLHFDQRCMGFSDKVWIRFLVNIKDEYDDNDLEPFYDGWYGPWKASIF